MHVKISSPAELGAVLEKLRARRGDNTYFEVNAAQDGLPTNIGTTICAFANMPEGGTIILGVSEPDFEIRGVSDPAVLASGLADVAQNVVSPSPTLGTATLRIGRKSVVVAYVNPIAITLKPALYANNPYLRRAGGNYMMSAAEMWLMDEAKLADPNVSMYDTRTIPETSVDDLAPEAREEYLNAVRREIKQIRDDSDDRILARTTVVRNDLLTLAGMYGLGAFPQGACPALGVSVSVRNPGAAPDARISNLKTFNGPLPELFQQTMDWIRENLDTRETLLPNGEKATAPELPLEAVREAVANALVHRDLGPYTVELGQRVQVRLEPDKLIISSPGGLKSLTLAQLLNDERTPVQANQRLYRIASLVTDGDGNRIVGGEGSGVKKMLQVMKDQGLPLPTIVDTGVSVTVVFPRGSELDSGSRANASESTPATGIESQENTSLAALGSSDAHDDRESQSSLRPLGRNAPVVVATLLQLGGSASIAEVAEAAQLSVNQTRYALNQLIEEGYAVRDGGRGHKNTTYRLA